MADSENYAKQLEDAVARLLEGGTVYYPRHEPDPDDPRLRPVPPTSDRLRATFKWEEETEDGEDLGPLVVFDPEDMAVLWESPDWMRLSEARALAAEKQWSFGQDGSSAADACNEAEDAAPSEADLREWARQGKAIMARMATEEWVRKYFRVPPDEELPEVAREFLEAMRTDTSPLPTSEDEA